MCYKNINIKFSAQFKVLGAIKQTCLNWIHYLLTITCMEFLLIYMCNHCLSPLKLWVLIQLRRGVLDTTVCDKVCQWFAAGQWFSPGTPVPSPIKLTATI